MAGITKRTTAFDDENLSGRSQKLYFEVTEEENYTYYGNHEVDFNKRTSIDCEGIDAHELNQKIYVKIRSTGKLIPSKVNVSGSKAKVNLMEDEFGISPGQACVFYQKNKNGYKVLGGGWIKN